MIPEGIVSISVSKLNLILTCINTVCVKFNLNNRFEMALGEINAEGKTWKAVGIYFDDISIITINIDEVYNVKDVIEYSITDKLIKLNIISPKIELKKND